ncbi:MAG: hypothetical protein WCI74_16720 [Actinomycetes bacterium]
MKHTRRPAATLLAAVAATTVLAATTPLDQMVADNTTVTAVIVATALTGLALIIHSRKFEKGALFRLAGTLTGILLMAAGVGAYAFWFWIIINPNGWEQLKAVAAHGLAYALLAGAMLAWAGSNTGNRKATHKDSVKD